MTIEILCIKQWLGFGFQIVLHVICVAVFVISTIPGLQLLLLSKRNITQGHLLLHVQEMWCHIRPIQQALFAIKVFEKMLKSMLD